MINGVINIYKEAGFTSHDVVAKLRGMLHQKKIGHTGTLDPDAVGVLPVCLGKATKLAESLTGDSKTYEAVLLLGRETDTQDSSGETISEKPVTCTEEEVRNCLTGFLGEQEQIPPMYSAKKQNGKRLYQLARSGVTVERKPSKIRIEKLELLSCELPRVELRVTCSKGTYIRTLCHDIGQKLGCGGCMERLVRTRVGMFGIEDALTLEALREKIDADTLQEAVLPPDSFFADLPAVRTDAELDRLVHNGNPVPEEAVPGAADDPGKERNETGRMAGSGAQAVQTGAWTDGGGKRIRVYDSTGAFMGVYARRASGRGYFPELFFYEAES